MFPLQKLALIHSQVQNWIDFKEEWFDQTRTLKPLVGYNAMCHLSQEDDYSDFPLIADGEILKSIGNYNEIILVIGSDTGNIVVYEHRSPAGDSVRCHGPSWFTRLTGLDQRDLDCRDLEDIFGDPAKWEHNPNIVKRFILAVELYCLE